MHLLPRSVRMCRDHPPWEEKSPASAPLPDHLSVCTLLHRLNCHIRSSGFRPSSLVSFPELLPGFPGPVLPCSPRLYKTQSLLCHSSFLLPPFHFLPSDHCRTERTSAQNASNCFKLIFTSSPLLLCFYYTAFPEKRPAYDRFLQ